MVTLGTGLGDAFIDKGEILRGKSGGAAEIGHIVFPDNKKRCTCGKTGCIETLLSERVLKELIGEITALAEIKGLGNNSTHIV